MKQIDYHVRQLEINFGGVSNRKLYNVDFFKFLKGGDDRRIIFFPNPYQKSFSINDDDLPQIASHLRAIPTLEEVIFHESFSDEQVDTMKQLLKKQLVLYRGTVNDDGNSFYDRR